MAVIFEARGGFALFRKGYTTTSSVSFPLPPPTALGGLIAAILGIDSGASTRGDQALYWERLTGNRVALRILNPLRYFRGSLNFWNVKEPQKNPHVQVKHQFLKDVAYRIYVEGPLEGPLEEILSRGGFRYTPYLGVAYALADLRWVGRVDRETLPPGPVHVSSVLPEADGTVLDVLASRGTFREILPFRMTQERGLTGSLSVYFAPRPDQCLVLTERGAADVARCGDDVVAFFPPW